MARVGALMLGGVLNSAGKNQRPFPAPRRPTRPGTFPQIQGSEDGRNWSGQTCSQRATSNHGLESPWLRKWSDRVVRPAAWR